MRVKIALFACFVFSFWLMFHTFKSDNKAIYVSAKVYSDFGSLIPLIKYFPQGLNWPIQHPLHPDEPIRYHFLFYAPIGLFEKIGVPISLALNIPSAMGLFCLLFLIFYLARTTSRNLTVGLISLILFIFNSSFSFLDYIRQFPLSYLPHLTNFVSFRPWNTSQITAFWSLNIYTNQRHLAFSFAVCLLIVTILYYLQGKYLLLVGILFGSLMLLNQAGFLISGILIAYSFIFISKIRKQLLLSMFGFLPWLILYKSIFPIPAIPDFYPGFLSDQPASFFNLVKFWFFNFGLALPLTVLSILFIPKKLASIFVSILTIFIIGNAFQLSPDMVNNHKLFNFISILSAILIAHLLVKIPKVLSLLLFPFLILGGVIDLFPIINDYYLTFSPSQDVEYFQSLPTESTILNSTWLYHPASMAGRAIFNGYSYFTWSYGYNQTERENQTINIFASLDIESLCSQLASTSISHIETSPDHESFIKISPLFNSLKPVYQNQSSNLKVYSVSQLCSNI